MPELPNRTELDAALTAVLTKELDSQRASLLALLGDEPDARRVPAEYWSNLAISIHAKLLPALVDAFVSAAQQHAGALDHPLDESELQSAALTWATEHVADLTHRFIVNSQAQVSDKIQAYYELKEKHAAELAALLLLLDDEFGTKRKRHDQLTAAGVHGLEEPITAEQMADERNQREAERRDYLGRYIDVPFGASRAESIAVNSHTSGTTAGERHVNGGYGERTGIKLVGVWKNDTRVGHTICPICRALDGLPEWAWPVEFKAGPPSPHPNCACSVEYQPAEKWADFRLSESQTEAIETAMAWARTAAGQVRLLELTSLAT